METFWGHTGFQRTRDRLKCQFSALFHPPPHSGSGRRAASNPLLRFSMMMMTGDTTVTWDGQTNAPGQAAAFELQPGDGHGPLFSPPPAFGQPKRQHGYRPDVPSADCRCMAAIDLFLLKPLSSSRHWLAPRVWMLVEPCVPPVLVAPPELLTPASGLLLPPVLVAPPLPLVTPASWAFGDCDVQEQSTCVPPGGPAPCAAACPPTECASDSDCQADGPSFICEGAWQCGECAAGVKICIPGCVDASGCNAGEVCTAHRCVPASCQSDVDCPTDFACAGGSCGRKTRTTDANCSGYCVEGLCYSAPGTCYGAVA